MTVKEQLVAARKLIDTPEKWGQKEYVSEDAQRICASEALRRARGGEFFAQVNSPAYRALQSEMSGKLVCAFNDEHTHAEVLAAFDRAIAKEGN